MRHPHVRAQVPVTSNIPFGRRSEFLGDDIVAAAMIVHHVHHAEVLTRSGDPKCTQTCRALLKATTNNTR